MLHQRYLHWQKVAQNECWMLQEKFYNYISRFETGGLENSITSKQKELKVKVLQFSTEIHSALSTDPVT
jgi:hypothetical protein